MAVRQADAIVSGRVKKVKNFLLNGYTRSAILRKSSVIAWNVSSRTVEDYIQKATIEIQELNKISFKQNMAIITDRYWDAYRQARKIKDVGEMNRILNSLSKIKGLDKIVIPPDDDDDEDDMSDEEMNEILESNEE